MQALLRTVDSTIPKQKLQQKILLHFLIFFCMQIKKQFFTYKLPTHSLQHHSQFDFLSHSNSHLSKPGLLVTVIIHSFIILQFLFNHSLFFYHHLTAAHYSHNCSNFGQIQFLIFKFLVTEQIHRIDNLAHSNYALI